MVDRFEIVPRVPFSLALSARFFERFAPATYGGIGEDLLRFAFVADGLVDGERVAGVVVRQEDDAVIGEVYGDADVEVVKRQVGRILLLDEDGRGFLEVAERDPVVGGLQRRYPGLRPVCFYSPYSVPAVLRTSPPPKSPSTISHNPGPYPGYGRGTGSGAKSMLLANSK